MKSPDVSNPPPTGQMPSGAESGKTSPPPKPKADKQSAADRAQKITERVFDHMQSLPPEKREAAIAREMIAATGVSEMLDRDVVSIGGARVYLDGLYPDGKRPVDAVEQMLFDQAAIAHHRLIQLQERANKAKTLEAAQVFNQAATRLMAEFRRFGLAIKQYRQPPSTKSFAVIHQQNVATGVAGQQNSYVDQSTAEKTQVSFSSRQSELEGKPIGGRFGAENEEFAESCCGDNQRQKAPALG